jgi:hypothetical protein
VDQLTFDQIAAAGNPVLCACGCGTPTPLAKHTDMRTGTVEGQPTRCIRGHGSRKRIDENGRECGKCGAYKPWDSFYFDRAATNGHSTICKTCAQAKNRAKSTGVGSGPKPRGRVDDLGRDCTGCGSYKPWGEYHLSSGGFLGHDSICRACKGIQAAERWLARPPADEWEPPVAGCPSSCGQYTGAIPLQYGIYVYRCWTSDDICIYVGKTRHAMRRFGGHALVSWWRDVHHVDVAVMADWAQADAEEIRQIRHWRPVNNSNYNRTWERRSTKPKPTECPKGHPYDAANTLYNRHGSKVCRTCKNDKARAKPKKGLARGERQHSAKLSGAAAADIRRRAGLGHSISSLARDYDVARSTIRSIVSYKTWAHIRRDGSEDLPFTEPQTPDAA